MDEPRKLPAGPPLNPVRPAKGDFAAALEAQGGRCAVCDGRVTAGKGTKRERKAVLDYCPATGKPRGAVCGTCRGLVLGVLGKPQLAADLCAYLFAWRAYHDGRLPEPLALIDRAGPKILDAVADAVKAALRSLGNGEAARPAEETPDAGPTGSAGGAALGAAGAEAAAGAEVGPADGGPGQDRPAAVEGGGP